MLHRTTTAALLAALGGRHPRPTQLGRLYALLRLRGPLGATLNLIFDYLYGDDPDGGPESVNIVRVYVFHLRELGFPVRQYPTGAYYLPPTPTNHPPLATLRYPPPRQAA